MAPSRRTFISLALGGMCSLSAKHAWSEDAPSNEPPAALPAQTSRLITPSLSAAEFGVRPDAGEDGSGTDNRAAFQAFLDELATGLYEEASIPRGRYALSDSVALNSTFVDRLSLYATGAELVFTTPRPAINRGYFGIWSPSHRGRHLRVEGLSLRLNRPAVRIGGSDMLRLSGFQSYEVEGLSIPSGDNMGLTIGRPERKGYYFAPQSILVRDCQIGGRREASPHSHGSIGDTAIWIVTPAEQTRITGCNIRETGDDGIYVGHSAATTIRRVEIDANTIRDAGARGVGVSIPYAHIHDNRIERTNSSGIVLESQDGANASDALIEANHIVAAGRLEVGEIGARMIPKRHTHGVFIHQAGGNITLRDNVIDAPRTDGLHMLSHSEGDLTGLRVEGGQFSGIGVEAGLDNSGQRGPVVFRRRGGAANSRCLDFEARGTRIVDSNGGLLSWTSNSTSPDGPVRLLDMELLRCNPPSDKDYVSVDGLVSAVEVSYRGVDSTAVIDPNRVGFPLSVTQTDEQAK